MTVPNAIGVIRLDSTQLVVEPKIPLRHVLHLFQRSGALPRIDPTLAELSTAESLWPIVASAYVTAAEGLLRSGLANGYRDVQDELPIARGRVVAGATATSFLKGRLGLTCVYELFDVDTPLNRVVKAAASCVSSSVVLTWDLRRRAARVVSQLEDVGRLRPSDLHQAQAERHTYRYLAPLDLARHVLAGTGRGIDDGHAHGTAFLIRTPDMIEEGIRQVVLSAMSHRIEVTKRTLFLSGSHHSLTPDLVFGPSIVGDVKYKLWGGDWDRPDLYQLVAFATGFDAIDAVRVGFSPVDHGEAVVNVGHVRLSACDWICDASLNPLAAESDFVSRLQAWLNEATRRRIDS